MYVDGASQTGGHGPGADLAIMSDVAGIERAILFRQRLGEMYRTPEDARYGQVAWPWKGRAVPADTEKAEEKPTAGPKTAAEESYKAGTKTHNGRRPVQGGRGRSPRMENLQAPKPEPAADEKKKRERPITEVWRGSRKWAGRGLASTSPT